MTRSNNFKPTLQLVHTKFSLRSYECTCMPIRGSVCSLKWILVILVFVCRFWRSHVVFSSVTRAFGVRIRNYDKPWKAGLQRFLLKIIRSACMHILSGLKSNSFVLILIKWSLIFKANPEMYSIMDKLHNQLSCLV